MRLGEVRFEEDETGGGTEDESSYFHSGAAFVASPGSLLPLAACGP